MTALTVGIALIGSAPFFILALVLAWKYWKLYKHLSRHSKKRRMFS